MEGETRLRRGDSSTEGVTHLQRGGSSRDYTRCYWECLEWPEHSICRFYVYQVSSLIFYLILHINIHNVVISALSIQYEMIKIVQYFPLRNHETITTVRHVTGNDQDYLRKIPRVVVQKSALL